MNTIVNFLAFQAGWLGSVLGAASGLPWVGPMIVLMVVALHLSIVARPGQEAILVVLAMLIGLVLDSALVAAGLVGYREGLFLPGIAPYWIIFMWAGFATTLNGSMRWLRGRPLLAVGFGLVSGPLVYLLGARLGALELVQPLPALLALALMWGLLMPLLSRLAERFDGTTVPGRPTAMTWLTH